MGEEKRGKGRGEQATGSALQAGRQREAQAGAGAHVAYFGRSRSAWPPRRPPTRPREASLEGRLHLVCEDLGRRHGAARGFLGVGAQRGAPDLGSPPSWGSSGRTPGSSGPLPLGGGIRRPDQ